MFKLVTLLLMCCCLRASTYAYAQCSKTTVLNVNTLSCTKCADPHTPNSGQSFPTSCMCSSSFMPSLNNACVNNSCASVNRFKALNNPNGSVNKTQLCQSCASNAYPNEYILPYTAKIPDACLVPSA